MLKPLHKEKSLLQKLYRESLMVSPTKVPKIAASDFTSVDAAEALARRPIAGLTGDSVVRSETPDSRHGFKRMVNPKGTVHRFVVPRQLNS